MSFANKTVLVTGGSSGIGRAAALAFAQQGARLFIADVDAEGGAATVQAIEAQGGTASYITCDVSRADEVQAMIQAALERYGTLDIAVNNAGISGGALLNIARTSEERYDRVMAVNTKGVWLCLKYEIPAMRENGGSIVNVASVAGLIGFPGGAAYAASKHAVVGLTKSVALEVASKGIRVNAICPSYVDTPMVTELAEQDARLAQRLPTASPMRRLGTPEEVAAGILWLASEEASFVNGLALALDGGLTAM